MVNIGLLLIFTVSSGIHQSQMLLPLLFQKGHVYFLEGGAFLCVPPPAAQHDLVEGVWTQPRLGQVDLRDRQRDEHLGRTLMASYLSITLTCRFWSLKNSPVFSITCSSVSWEYGCSLQKLSISHSVTPKAHTSLAVVNLPCVTKTTMSALYSPQISCIPSPWRTSRMLSHDIQRMGSTALPWIR